METRIIPTRYVDIIKPRVLLKEPALGGTAPPLLFKNTKEPIRLPAVEGIGVLDTLPTELLDEVLLELDLDTLFTFRRVNRRAKEVVDCLPQYEAIVTYAPNTLMGIQNIKTGSWITCRRLYEKLCTPECSDCGNFGGYLHLIACNRLCSPCLSWELDRIPYFSCITGVTRKLNPLLVDSLPHATYIDEKGVQKVYHDRASLQQALIKVYGSIVGATEFVYRVTASVGFECVRYSYFDKSEIHNISLHPIIVQVPWLDMPAQKIDWGFQCLVCDHAWQKNWIMILFTASGFERHLGEHGDIQNKEHV
ncbi:hypothetical protein GQ44DRAFT_781942 [Phaeosphaeriaceae sp. PMI808]|nr:hypothetical protein GQ44DRAFT_781942 [Phaeosphaeriaceae sp. PMI808]